MKQFRYAINTNQFRNHQSTAEIVDLCAKAPVQGIEWGLRKVETSASDVREMKQRTDDADLEIAGFLNAGSLWDFDEIRQWSEAVAQCRPTTLRVNPPWFAWDYNESLHQKNSYLDLVKHTKDALLHLASLACEYGIKYVIEIHAGSIAASPWAMHHMLEDIDPDCVGVIYDPANTIIEGFIRPRGACELLGNHLAYVHAKNLTFVPAATYSETDEPRRSHWQFHRTFLDQGMVDYVEVYFALKLAGFHGWISLEEFATNDPVREVSRNVHFLEQCNQTVPTQLLEPFSNFPAPVDQSARAESAQF